MFNRQGRVSLFTTAAIVTLSILVLQPGLAAAHWRGTVAATGNGGGTAISVGDAATSMCPGYPTGRTEATASGGSVGLAISPNLGSDGCTASQYPQGRYLVSFYNGDAYGVLADGSYASGISGIGCRHQTIDKFHGPNGAAVRIGFIEIDAQGFGSGGPYALPDNLVPNSASYTSEVCVTAMHDSTITASAPVAIVP